MSRYINSLLFCMLSLLAPLALADSAGVPVTQQCSANDINYDQAVTLVAKLQLAIKNNDKQVIAKMLGYPVRINQGTKHYVINNEKNFMKKYPIIFTDKVKHKIINADSADIFCNDQGAMIADGAVWFNGNPLKIFSLNLI